MCVGSVSQNYATFCVLLHKNQTVQPQAHKKIFCSSSLSRALIIKTRPHCTPNPPAFAPRCSRQSLLRLSKRDSCLHLPKRGTLRPPSPRLSTLRDLPTRLGSCCPRASFTTPRRRCPRRTRPLRHFCLTAIPERLRPGIPSNTTSQTCPS